MRAMRMLFVLVVAVFALALPAAAGAFVPPNPTVHYKPAATSTVGWSGSDVGVAILCGVATVLLCGCDAFNAIDDAAPVTGPASLRTPMRCEAAPGGAPATQIRPWPSST